MARKNTFVARFDFLLPPSKPAKSEKRMKRRRKGGKAEAAAAAAAEEEMKEEEEAGAEEGQVVVREVTVSFTMTANGELKVGVLTPAQVARARAEGILHDRGDDDWAEVQSRSVEVEQAAQRANETMLIAMIIVLAVLFLALKLTMRDLDMIYDDPYETYKANIAENDLEARKVADAGGSSGISDDEF